MNNYLKEVKEIETIAAELLIEKNFTIATAESCTGGMLSARLINYPGISKVFLEGVVTYSNEAKIKRLGVRSDTLSTYGAVSKETAAEMAQGMCRVSGSNVSVVTTGIAGPGGGTPNKPVGLVYIGVCVNGEVTVEKHIFNGDRNEVRNQSVISALELLIRIIK